MQKIAKDSLLIKKFLVPQVMLIFKGDQSLLGFLQKYQELLNLRKKAPNIKIVPDEILHKKGPMNFPPTGLQMSR